MCELKKFIDVTLIHKCLLLKNEVFFLLLLLVASTLTYHHYSLLLSFISALGELFFINIHHFPIQIINHGGWVRIIIWRLNMSNILYAKDIAAKEKESKKRKKKTPFTPWVAAMIFIYIRKAGRKFPLSFSLFLFFYLWTRKFSINKCTK